MRCHPLPDVCRLTNVEQSASRGSFSVAGRREEVNQMIVLQCHHFILSNIHHQVNQGGGASAPQHHQPQLEDCEVSPTAPPVPFEEVAGYLADPDVIVSS